jgi:hypothetical protein
MAPNSIPSSNNNIILSESPPTAPEATLFEKSDSIGDVGIYGGGDSPSIDLYEGVILTTYQIYLDGTREKVTDYNTLSGGEKVFLRERGADHGLKAVFLENLQKDTSHDGDIEYIGTYLNVEEAAAKIKEAAGGRTPLFCVHGNKTEAGNWMYSVDEAKWKDSNHYGVPVCWPLFSAGAENLTYGQNRDDNAPPSGETLTPFVDEIPNHIFPKKSLLMYSMGAHVVLNWACRSRTPDVEFENLFFVAAVS